MTTADAIVLIAYLAGMLALGVFYMRRNTSLKQMFAAGHQSPWWVAGLSGFMTMFSAGTFVVWGGLAYRSGLVAVAVNMAYGVAALLAGAFLAARWRTLGVSSPADYVRLRFGESAVQLYLWVMMLFRLIGSGIALYALSVLLCVLVPLEPGHVLRDPATGNLSVTFAVLAFGAVIVLYTMLGGLWAVLMTDVMQFIVLNLAVLITVILILARLGGLEGFAERVPQGFFALTNDDYGWWFIAAWTVIHFFMIGAEWAFVQRFISVPTPRDARRSAWLFGGLYLISPAFWLLPPMLYRAIDPTANPEQAYMLAAQAVLPAGMLGLVLAAMFSATASLISGQLNVFAGALTPMLTRGRDGVAEVRIGRIVTIGLGMFLTTVAILIPLLGGAEKVIVAATSLLVVPLVAPSVWGFFSDRVDQRSAWLTVIAAGAVGLFLRYLITPAGPLGDVAALRPLQQWAAGAGILIDVIVGVAVPMLVLGAYHLLARRTAPGVARIAALPPAAEASGEGGASDAPRIVALTVGASGVLLWMTAITASAEDRTILLVTGAALAALALFSEWIGRRGARAMRTGSDGMGGRFEGRQILVTGASGGIGGAVIDGFRREGGWVCALGHSRPGNGDLNLAADLGSDEAVADALAALHDAGGAADIVVHSGAASVNAGIADTPSADWLRIYDVNVVGAVRLIRGCAPAMAAKGGGNFVLISSINARFATPTLAAYATSKAALDGLIRTAALDLAPQGIRVNGVAPASVDTPLLARNFDSAPDPQAARAANVGRHPLGRLGTPQDVAETVLFVASAAAGWMTGTIVELDGGAGVTRR